MDDATAFKGFEALGRSRHPVSGRSLRVLRDVLTAIAIGYRFKSPSAFPFEECSINSQCRCGFLSGEL